MARTNIEEEAWRRINKLARVMKVSDREAAGTAACLWTDSQDLSKTSGTRNEIIDWAHLFDLSDEEADRWVDGLVRARFLSDLPDGTFKINGNDVQIRSRDEHLEKSKRGAAATKARWEKIRTEREEGQSNASGMPEACPSNATAMPAPDQFNAMQFNAIQYNPTTPEGGGGGNQVAESPEPDPRPEISQSPPDLTRPEPAPDPKTPLPDPRFGPRELAAAWNERMASVRTVRGTPMPLVEKLDSKQERWIMARARLAEEPRREVWLDVIDRIARSEFCRGKGSKSDWVANFIFLVRPKTLIGVLEGEYGCTPKVQARAQPPPPIANIDVIPDDPEERRRRMEHVRASMPVNLRRHSEVS